MAFGKRFKPEKKSKYGNVKTVYKEMTFDSKRELERYKKLEWMLLAKDIFELRRQVKFPYESTYSANGLSLTIKNNYIADFTYYDKGGNFIVEDSKGAITKEFALKKKIIEHTYEVKILLT
jgi:hypothetical protein